MMQDTDERKILLYMHAGSGNHGCEAIVNALSRMLSHRPVLLSYRKDEDLKYTLGGLCDIREEKRFEKHKLAHLFYYGYRLLTKDTESFIRFRYGEFLKKGASSRYPLAVSIGGDNYCYDVMLNDLFLANSAFNRQGTKTVLLGCSIEPELLEKKEILEDLSKYHTIIARESITYDALREAFPDGKGPKLYNVPDPAFTLPPKEDAALPEGFLPGKTVGINISPMILEHEKKSGITMEAYKELILHILNTTDLSVALIPHVVWDNNDDRRSIDTLYEYVKRDIPNEKRLIRAGDADCECLKSLIGKCRFFIGARTHATIAAYSSLVPTLVVGYSVKALGIAKDLFPDRDTSELVFPVQKLSDKNDLLNAFQRLQDDEESIREHLAKIMPEYQKKASEASVILQSI